MMRIQQFTPPPSLALCLLLVAAGSQGAPNATKSSFFPSSPIVDVTKGNADPYMAAGSEFFPDSSTQTLKFPGSQPQLQGRQQSSNSEAAFHAQRQQYNFQNQQHHQQQQQPHQQQQQQQQQQQNNQAPSVVIPIEQQQNTDEAEANEAIDVILKTARSGKSLDLPKGGEEIVKVASDPVIKAQLASGNEAEARGYIRNKLCSLGLMPCNHHGPVDKQGLLPAGSAPYGVGHGWAPGIPARDVTLVQPVALKPVGHPIAAVPLDHHKPHHPPPIHPPHFGHGKVYGRPPPPHPPKPVYRPGYGPPPPPPIGHSGIPPPGKPVIEHVHHHIHHQPTVHHHGPPTSVHQFNGPSYTTSSGWSSEEFGLSAKNPVSISTTGGDPVKVASFIPPPPAQKSQSFDEIETNSFNVGSSRFHSASSSSFSSNGGSSFEGGSNRIEDCTCVRITQCAAYDIVGQSTSGREIISGFGKPNYGQVGYGIDPRNKFASGIESNSTDASSSGEEGSSESGESQNEGRSFMTKIEADSTEDEETTTTQPDSSEQKPRSKRDTSNVADGQQTGYNSPVQDEQTAASGDGESEPKPPAHGEGRVFGTLLNGMNNNYLIRNLTRFMGYDFGDDPTQLVKIEDTNLRILGKLVALEPTFGVSFGLPGGYPQAGGGYPINPVDNNPLVNPYQGGGIPLGPISINPLVSFQKTKDKKKVKLLKPLVNLHITPNVHVFKGIKALVKATKGKGLFGGWGAPEYNYGGGWNSPFKAVPVPYAVPVSGGGSGIGSYFGGFGGFNRPRPIHHSHDHFHHYPTAHSSPFVSRPSYGSATGSPFSSPYYAGSSGYGYSSATPYVSSSASSGWRKGSYPSIEYSPYKLDKQGPLDSSTGPSGPSGTGLSSSLPSKRPGKKPGSVSEISGLTPEQESLLEALLKEDEEEHRSSSSRFRSGLDKIKNSISSNNNNNNNNKRRPTGGKVEFVDSSTSSHNSNGFSHYSGGGSSFSSKTKFPEDSPSGNSNNGFSSSSSSSNSNNYGSGNSNDDNVRSPRTLLPLSFPDSRLPPNAASVSASSSDSYSQGSSMIFPQENHDSSSTSSSSSSNSDQTKSLYHSFNENNGDDDKNNNYYQQQQPQGSAVTFPSDSSSTSLRMKREIRTQPLPPTATIDGRVILPYIDDDNDERQLNLGGGSCPGGYVCCRSPRQNNLYKPSGSGTNNFQQVSNSPFGGSSSNSLNSFNPGTGQCGRRNARGITGRISNPGFTEGETDYGEYPWQVAILKKDGYDNVYVCGGALIDNKHVITAAHCIKGHAPTELRVRLGEWDVNHETEFYPHVERDVAAIAIHPEFYAGNLFNDVAIVRIEGYVDFRQNPHISPVCLPAKGYDFSGQRCFVTGWGKDAFGEIGKYQNVLKEVDLPVVSNFECEQKLKRTRLGADFSLHPGFMCAGGEAGRDACKGDGGGPLVCEVGSSWQIAGIVSWGVGCGQQDVPGVYVKVSRYNDWIKKTIGGY